MSEHPSTLLLRAGLHLVPFSLQAGVRASAARKAFLSRSCLMLCSLLAVVTVKGQTPLSSLLQISHIEGLESCTQLEELCLEDNRLTAIEGLQGLGR